LLFREAFLGHSPMMRYEQKLETHLLSPPTIDAPSFQHWNSMPGFARFMKRFHRLVSFSTLLQILAVTCMSSTIMLELDF
jgi:hypothetical protein